jgi:Fe-S-cluster containining protein
MSLGLAKLREAVQPYEPLHKQIDEWVATIPDSGPLGDIACGKGCASCCRKIITISIPEAIYCVSNYAEFVETGSSLGIECDCLSQIDRIKAENIQTAHEWWDARITCPFLSFDKLCKIYKWRPSACRSYLVFDGSEQCDQPADHLVKQLDNTRAIQLTMEWDAAIAKELKITASPFPLPIAVRAAIYALTRGLYDLRAMLKRL